MSVTKKEFLSHFPKLSQKEALQLVRLCNGTLDPEEFPAAKRRLAECYNRPTDTDLVLNIANELLGGFGVEGAALFEDALYDSDFVSYVNLGDTYYTTLCFDPENDEFVLTSCGDLLENSETYQEWQREEQEQTEAL